MALRKSTPDDLSYFPGATIMTLFNISIQIVMTVFGMHKLLKALIADVMKPLLLGTLSGTISKGPKQKTGARTQNVFWCKRDYAKGVLRGNRGGTSPRGDAKSKENPFFVVQVLAFSTFSQSRSARPAGTWRLDSTKTAQFPPAWCAPLKSGQEFGLTAP